MKTSTSIKSNKLFRKIFSLSILCMLIPMLVALFFASYYSTRSLQSEASNTLLSVAAEKSSQIDLSFKDILNISNDISTSPSAVDFFRDTKKTGQVDPLKKKTLADY